MTTRPKLEGTVLGPVDLNDQPRLQYIFLIDTSAGGRQAFAVESTFVGENFVDGYRGKEVVIRVPAAASWTILHRSLVIYRTVEESIRKLHEDGKTEHELVQSLADPIQERPGPVPPIVLPIEDRAYL